MPATRPLEERFWAKVDKNGPVMPRMKTRCWVWTASTDGCGYGWIGLGPGRGLGKAHRLSFEMHNGGIGEERCVLHHCDNPPCVRPDHLFEGTQKDNADDRERKGRGNQVRGDAHPARLHPENLVRGERHHMRRDPSLRYWGEKNSKAKLTEEKVRSIRQEFDPASMEYADLAQKYGVTASAIGRVILRKTWPHVE